MAKPSGRTPDGITANLLRDYALAAITLNDEAQDGDHNPILLAIGEAVVTDEVLHLGRAWLARCHALSDLSYRPGGADCDPDLQRIADRLGWQS